MAGDLFGERESDLAILSAIETRIAAAHARYGDFASTHEALGVAVEEWVNCSTPSVQPSCGPLARRRSP